MTSSGTLNPTSSGDLRPERALTETSNNSRRRAVKDHVTRWGLLAAMILAMVFPNMIGLFFLFPRVREELARYLKAIGKA